MGYYTRFALTVEPADAWDRAQEEIGKVWEDESPFEKPGWHTDSLKWYDWEDGLKKASAQLPDVMFILDGEGEEQGDVWRAFFRAGDVQVHKAKAWTPPSEPSPPMFWLTIEQLTAVAAAAWGDPDAHAFRSDEYEEEEDEDPIWIFTANNMPYDWTGAQSEREVLMQAIRNAP